MLTDIQRAMLGDHEAAARLTEQGVLIPCPWCKKTVAHVGAYDVVCNFFAGGCGASTGARESAEEALAAWNTRAPILSVEEMEMLHGKENP